MTDPGEDQDVAAFEQRQALYVLAEYVVGRAEDEALRRLFLQQNARRILAEVLMCP